MPIKLSKTNYLKVERSIETKYKCNKVLSPMQTSNHMRALKTQSIQTHVTHQRGSFILGLQPKALIIKFQIYRYFYIPIKIQNSFFNLTKNQPLHITQQKLHVY